MKSFLTIRGNLLLINFVVIGLILWLAISFLYIAVAQQTEARHLQINVDTEKTVFQANYALAYELDNYNHFLQSPEKLTAQQYQRLKTAGLESDNRLDKMTAQIMRQITEHNLSPEARAILNRQLRELESHRTHLAVYRAYSLSQGLLESDSRDHEISSYLSDTQIKIIKEIIGLTKSLKYLPDSNASEISNYHTLLTEILITDVELSQKNIVLRNIVSGNTTVGLKSRVQVAALNRNIEQRLTDILMLAQASDNASTLLPIAISAIQFYKQDYHRAEKRVNSIANSSPSSKNSAAEWLAINASLSDITKQLAEAAHASIEILANRHGTRAKRNLIIDVFLVFLCFMITLASIAINRKVKKHAYHDGLTNLPNRMNFESTLQSTSLLNSQMHAVIFIDLDRFKSINDNYGHAIGDELLIEVANRLKENCLSKHFLARMGGDEFAVFVSDVESESAVVNLASRIVTSLEKNIIVRELSLKVGASAGISIAPLDSDCAIELLKNADIAMYYNKANKLNGVCRFNQVMAGDYQKRLQLEWDLKKGIENDEFLLVYQPKICTLSGQVHSVEALLRWIHPKHGFVSPAQFIPVAEETGLMGRIGQWVLKEACREIALLQTNGLKQLRVAVNVSAQQFSDEHFVDSVYNVLNTNGLSHESLELEVTESIVMTDVARVISMLGTLKDSGIMVAIDDFGTGYSSLQYLQELPLNTLKIDRAFVLALDHCDPSHSVANSIVQLAKLFDLDTVAEGVETSDQDMKIRSLGVHHIQGYLYSKPVPASELPAVIQNLHDKADWHNTIKQQRSA